MKPGEKEVNTLLRNEASCLFSSNPNPLSLAATNGVSVDFLPLATKMFQFAKF